MLIDKRAVAATALAAIMALRRWRGHTVLSATVFSRRRLPPTIRSRLMNWIFRR